MNAWCSSNSDWWEKNCLVQLSFFFFFPSVKIGLFLFHELNHISFLEYLEVTFHHSLFPVYPEKLSTQDFNTWLPVLLIKRVYNGMSTHSSTYSAYPNPQSFDRRTKHLYSKTHYNLFFSHSTFSLQHFTIFLQVFSFTFLHVIIYVQMQVLFHSSSLVFFFFSHLHSQMLPPFLHTAHFSHASSPEEKNNGILTWLLRF